MSILNKGKDRIDFYQNSKRGKLLRVLTLSDISYWAADAFIAVVLVLYVIEFIDGGSATHLGLAFFVYKAVSATLSIPVGKFFDKHKGYLDEIWGLALSSFAAGITYILLSFSTQLWQLYAAMFVLGFLSIVNINSWRILFYNNIEKEEYGETVGVYQALMSIAGGFALALGGFFGDTFGFNLVLLYGGIIIMLGGFIPLTAKYFVPSE